MDSLTFTIEMTKALAWPVSIALLAVTFRPQFIGLLERLKHVQAPGVQMDFSDKLDQVEEQLPPADHPFVAPAIAAPHVETDLPPDYIILAAWRRLEDRLRELATKRGLDGDRYRSAARLFIKLDLPEPLSKTINDLRVLRNDAVHKQGQPPSMTDALRYVDLANVALRSFPEK